MSADAALNCYTRRRAIGPIVSALAVLTAADLLYATAQQQPVFKAAADVILVDVQVSNGKWQPIKDLSQLDFEVSIDGRRRNIVGAQYVNIGSGEEVGEARPIHAPMEIPTSRFAPPEGRTLIVAVDQSSLLVVNESAAIEAVSRLLAMAPAEDKIGLVAYPEPGVSVAPTRDRDAVRSALRRIGGLNFPVMTPYNISLSEAVDFSAGDQDVKSRVLQRECRIADRICVMQVTDVAKQIVVETEIQALRSVNGLKSVVEAVREWPGRKTLVVVSAGLITTDRVGARPDIAFEADTLGRGAAETNTIIYTLHLDVAFLTQFSAKNRGRVQTVYRDAGLAANGLERFTGNAGGSLITVHAGPDQALRRLLQETSAYYLLAIETTAADRDDKTHSIRVKVKRRGATIRARNNVFIPRDQ